MGCGLYLEEKMRDVKDLIGKNIVTYDVEIKKPIEQCSNGWNSKDEMGVSVAVAFDYRINRYRIFLDDNLPELIERLNEPGTLIVGFNHIHFDNDLLRKTPETKIQLKPDNELKNYDMLKVSWAGCGVDRAFGGFKLDHHLEALGLPMKTADGAQAPRWWQSKELGKLIDYCVNDVTQEKGLFEYMYVHGELACKAYPKKYAIKVPEIG